MANSERQQSAFFCLPIFTFTARKPSYHILDLNLSQSMQKYLTLQQIAQGTYPQGLPLIFIYLLFLYLHWECMQDSKQQNLTTT